MPRSRSDQSKKPGRTPVEEDDTDSSVDVPKSRKKRDAEAEALGKVKQSMSKRGSSSSKPAPASKPRASRTKKASKGTRRGKRSGGGPQGWRSWVALEALTILGGLLVGLGITVGLMWVRAERDVAAYLANPPRPVPSVVWSAPMEIRPGVAASVQAIAGDLLAAGYERVETVPSQPPTSSSGAAAGSAAGQFVVEDDRIDLWTTPWSGPTGKVPGGKGQIVVVDGKVAKTTPATLVLRPTVLGTLGDLETRRDRITLDQMSRWVEPALLSMEDSRFRQHRGVDLVGIFRAAIINLFSDDVQGASTLTQQLAKNLFLSKERTVRRKVREVFFAAALESQLDKDELLELYLSEVYLGQMGGLPLYGVDAAARAWFGISAQHLELHQAATIVGVIPAPNTWSPVRSPEGAKERRDLVLQKMADDGVIDEATRAAATARPLELKGLEPSRIRRAPYAVDAAVDRAEEALGEGALASKGYAVHTAIQPLLQRAAEQAVAEGMAELDKEYPKAAGAQVALVAVRVEDGAVVALVGGRSYAASAFNRARDAHRQAGSTVKPLTMLAAFEKGVANPSTLLEDAPFEEPPFGNKEGWAPRNYDGEYLEEVTVRETIEGSRNVPTVHLAELVGLGPVTRFYRDVGLSEAKAFPSTVLGSFGATPMEMAGAYTAFDEGMAYRPRVLLAIADPAGGEVLEFPPEAQHVASEAAAALAVHVMEGVLTHGTGSRASHYGVGPPAAGKTGTTDDYRDAWFVGVTPELAVAVWVGRDEGLIGLSGSRAALPTWARFVAATGMPKGPRPVPDGLVAAKACAESGQPARDACPETFEEWYLEGELPNEKCPDHGGPLVRTGQMFGKLFGKRRKAADEDELEADPEVVADPQVD